MKKPLAIVLLSGGMDSCVTAAIADRNYQVAFLHITYGQRTQEREQKAFHDIADHYHVDRRLIADIGYLKEIGGSSLTDDSIFMDSLPSNGTPIPSTYVPFRNTHFLSIATSWGEVMGARQVFIGAVEQDSSGYPDCTTSYFKAFNQLIKEGTKPQTSITIQTPIIHLTKKEIVSKAMELNAPLHLTWSCYKNNQRACGLCDSCLLRLKGFKEAGFTDPITYDHPPSR